MKNKYLVGFIVLLILVGAGYVLFGGNNKLFKGSFGDINGEAESDEVSSSGVEEVETECPVLEECANDPDPETCGRNVATNARSTIEELTSETKILKNQLVELTSIKDTLYAATESASEAYKTAKDEYNAAAVEADKLNGQLTVAKDLVKAAKNLQDKDAAFQRAKAAFDTAKANRDNLNRGNRPSSASERQRIERAYLTAEENLKTAKAARNTAFGEYTTARDAYKTAFGKKYSDTDFVGAARGAQIMVNELPRKVVEANRAKGEKERSLNEKDQAVRQAGDQLAEAQANLASATENFNRKNSEIDIQSTRLTNAQKSVKCLEKNRLIQQRRAAAAEEAERLAQEQTAQVQSPEQANLASTFPNQPIEQRLIQCLSYLPNADIAECRQFVQWAREGTLTNNIAAFYDGRWEHAHRCLLTYPDMGKWPLLSTCKELYKSVGQNEPVSSEIPADTPGASNWSLCLQEFPNILSWSAADDVTCADYRRWEMEGALTSNGYKSNILFACRELYPEVMGVMPSGGGYYVQEVCPKERPWWNGSQCVEWPTPTAVQGEETAVSVVPSITADFESCTNVPGNIWDSEAKQCCPAGTVWSAGDRGCVRLQPPPGSFGPPPGGQPPYYGPPPGQPQNGPNYYPGPMQPGPGGGMSQQSPDQQQQCGAQGGIWNVNGPICCFPPTVPQGSNCELPNQSPPPGGPQQSPEQEEVPVPPSE